MKKETILLAGVPAVNQTLYHRIRFSVGDSTAWIGNLPESKGSILLVRDIEMERARQNALADEVACAADFTPEGGLSGDRDTALAQATVECLLRKGVSSVFTERTLPFLFAWHLQQSGIELRYDAELGVRERRVKDEEEIAALTKAQEVTGQAMTMACQWIARAETDGDGLLVQDGEVVTSERVRRRITRFLIDRGFTNPDSIVSTVPHVADCHHLGTGPLKSGFPVIIDIFPRDNESKYNGDCTRTVVHGEPSEEASRMHLAVCAANRAGCNALCPGTTGEAVHRAVVAVIEANRFAFKRGSSGKEEAVPAMRHGTGHGIGLDVHEPILLDEGGGKILRGEVFTVEPGLYSAEHGGVRVEDMVLVTDSGSRILGGELHRGLNWD